MITVYSVLLMALLVLSPSLSSGQTFKDASEARLSNGLKVIMLENHKAPIVSFQVWYRAGSRYEETGKTGLAHVLEHLMFKGTRKVSGEDFTRIIDELGGQENAFTSNDFAGYFENLVSSQIGVLIELESDRMANLVLKESDFRTERMVVMEERRMRVDDNPQAFLVEQFEAAAYQSQPYRWPVIGWVDDLERLTLEDVRAFYTAFYNPANAFLVIAGDFKKESLIPELEKAFGKIASGMPGPQFHLQDPPQAGERRVLVERPAQVGTIMIGYHVPNLKSQDSYVLEVIRALLSEGKSSRLYDNLVRSSAVALEAAAGYSLTTRDPGLFYLMASVLPGKDMADVENAFYEQIDLLKSNPVEARELEKAKNQLEAAFVFSQDSIFSLAKSLAEYEIAYDWAAIGNYVPSIRSVTAEEIQRVAAKYFAPQGRTVGVLLPTGPPDQAPAPAGGGLKDKAIRLNN
ncbi:MAG: M16 family metallopeptidase [Syntrophobacteraceae bacterium]